MDKRLTIFYSIGRLSIEVQNGTTRSTSGKPSDVIKSMNYDDLGILVAFCKGIIAAVDAPAGKPSAFLE